MPSCDGAMSMSDIHEEERRQERTIETLRKENEELKNQLEKLKSITAALHTPFFYYQKHRGYAISRGVVHIPNHVCGIIYASS